MLTIKLLSVNINFLHLKDCHMHMLSLKSIKMYLEAVSSNFIPIIISGHMVNENELQT